MTSIMLLSNFADDNTIFACGETLDKVSKGIENDKRIAMNWFKLNEMVANPGKFQLIFIKISDTVKLLSVIIDSKLRFNEHC